LQLAPGDLGEWFKPAVLKTADPQGSVSSNLTVSARYLVNPGLTASFSNVHTFKPIKENFLNRFFNLGSQGSLFFDKICTSSNAEMIGPLAQLWPAVPPLLPHPPRS
jgi:hypothetical protein